MWSADVIFCVLWMWLYVALYIPCKLATMTYSFRITRIVHSTIYRTLHDPSLWIFLSAVFEEEKNSPQLRLELGSFRLQAHSQTDNFIEKLLKLLSTQIYIYIYSPIGQAIVVKTISEHTGWTMFLPHFSIMCWYNFSWILQQ